MTREQLKQSFLEEWPIDRVSTMSIDEYTNLDKNSFCYWVEAKTVDLGSIWGGSAFKFGIYKKHSSKVNSNKGYSTDNEHAWLTKYGSTANDAFNKVRSIICDIIDAASHDELERIDKVDLGPAYRWKIAFLYADYKVINIYMTSALQYVAESLGMIDASNSLTSTIHRYIISHKPDNENFFEFTRRLWLEYETSLKETEDSTKIELTNITKSNNDNTNNGVASLNTILYGPPGTGKTYNTVNKALEILGVETAGVEREILKRKFDDRVAAGEIVFTTFHQSMSYEDFIEGIKPIEPRIEGQPVIYKVVDGIFKRVCSVRNHYGVGDKIGKYEVVSITPEVVTLKKPNGSHVPFTFKMLYKLLEYLEYRGIDIQSFDGTIDLNESERNLYPELEAYLVNGYKNVVPSVLKLLNGTAPTSSSTVLIIDEINRGNVSQIFGELITLIEEDKRLGRSEQLEVTLPYSKEKFGVPANLYIIGTMNTADRSVEALDTALRRRFSFVEMPPRYDLQELENSVEGYPLKDILLKINRRIEKLLGKDNLIGHSYFLCVKSSDDLRAAFQNKIIPLLQEYFYGDYGKIGLVLGEGFLKTIEDEDDAIFATFGNYDASGLEEKEVYHLAELVGKNRLNDQEFGEALHALMR